MTTRRATPVLFAALLSLASVGAHADAPAAGPGSQGRSAAATPPSAAGIDQLGWMAGHWRFEDADHGVVVEEVWLAPRGGLMVGMNRQAADRGAGFEHLRIEQRKDGVVYVASPGGQPPEDFPLAESSKDRAVFARPGDDFPNRIVYALDGPDTLVATIEGSMDGKPASMQFKWTRVK